MLSYRIPWLSVKRRENKQIDKEGKENKACISPEEAFLGKKAQGKMF